MVYEVQFAYLHVFRGHVNVCRSARTAICDCARAGKSGLCSPQAVEVPNLVKTKQKIKAVKLVLPTAASQGFFPS